MVDDVIVLSLSDGVVATSIVVLSLEGVFVVHVSDVVCSFVDIIFVRGDMLGVTGSNICTIKVVNKGNFFIYEHTKCDIVREM